MNKLVALLGFYTPRSGLPSILKGYAPEPKRYSFCGAFWYGGSAAQGLGESNHDESGRAVIFEVSWDPDRLLSFKETSRSDQDDLVQYDLRYQDGWYYGEYARCYEGNITERGSCRLCLNVFS